MDPPIFSAFDLGAATGTMMRNGGIYAMLRRSRTTATWHAIPFFMHIQLITYYAKKSV
jgi:hypothetical protein